MNHDAMLRGLVSDRADDLLPLLRQAFEIGYRDGMSAAGTVVPPPAASAPVPTVEPAMVLAAEDEATESRASDTEADEGALDDDVDEIIEEAPPQNGEPTRRRFTGIRASATVAGLLAEIERVFRIEERFDLVVRIEHPKSGRAPKRHMRLSAYAREG